MLITFVRRRAGFTLIELLVVIAIIAVLVGLLLPAVQKVREAAARTKCSNNLKQIGLALHNYHSTFNGFPPGILVTASGASHNFATLILPYLEQNNVYNQYKFSANWNDVGNDSGVIQNSISTFVCPSAPDPASRSNTNNRGVLDYPAINQFNRPNPYALNGVPPQNHQFWGVLGNNVSRKVTDITDGSSNTVFVIECAGRDDRWAMGVKTGTVLNGNPGSWANPNGDVIFNGYNPATASSPGPVAINGTNNHNPYAFHTAVCGGLFADGSVHFLSASTGVDTLIALETLSYGEVIPADAFN